MAQYIGKDALLAEIERKTRTEQGYSSGDAECGYLDCAREILSFLDTLEVKEKELDYDDYITFFKDHPEYNYGEWGFEETWTFGQYCYKLGLKAQQGE
jgi:hypothetical protein